MLIIWKNPSEVKFVSSVFKTNFNSFEIKEFFGFFLTI